jgi:hypothetical protein
MKLPRPCADTAAGTTYLSIEPRTPYGTTPLTLVEEPPEPDCSAGTVVSDATSDATDTPYTRPTVLRSRHLSSSRISIVIRS